MAVIIYGEDTPTDSEYYSKPFYVNALKMMWIYGGG